MNDPDFEGITDSDEEALAHGDFGSAAAEAVQLKHDDATVETDTVQEPAHSPPEGGKPGQAAGSGNGPSQASGGPSSGGGKRGFSTLIKKPKGGKNKQDPMSDIPS